MNELELDTLQEEWMQDAVSKKFDAAICSPKLIVKWLQGHYLSSDAIDITGIEDTNECDIDTLFALLIAGTNRQSIAARFALREKLMDEMADTFEQEVYKEWATEGDPS